MRNGRRHLAAAGVLLGVAAFVGVVGATTITSNGITMEYPTFPLTGPALLSCEPWEEPASSHITLTNIPVGANVSVTFTWANPYSGAPNYLPPVVYANVTGGTLVVPVSYPMDTTMWPVWDQTTNERAIAVAAFVRITNSSNVVLAKLVSKQWWVRCLPPQRPKEGCTPGYWRQEQHFDSWAATPYATTDDFETVFGVNATFDPDTLLDAIWLGGGGERALARHAVAAILNAASPDVNYQFTVAEIITGVQNAYATGDFEPFKNQLDFANNAGCPLN